jgi:chromosomal replication initiator protein
MQVREPSAGSDGGVEKAPSPVLQALPPQDLWGKTLEALSAKLNPKTFETWFSKTKGLTLEGRVLTVEVPKPFIADWLSQHYQNFVEDAMEDLVKERHRVVFLYPPAQNLARTKGKGVTSEMTPPHMAESQLNPRYTFENFVVGKSNEFAFATAMAVAEKPGTVYNPLFIYGGTGVGKTHLMQAIGQFAMRERSKSRVYYTPSESFMNELISAIQHRQMLDFKRKYRMVDLLLLDDVQFLAEKEGLQEEIFHTFNALYDNRRQIVITSDRPPRDLIHLQDRLVSRFQGGMVADMQPPDLGLRIAILKHFAERDGHAVPNEVLYFLADKVTSNIRELEGCLVRLLAFSSLSGAEITPDLAQEALGEILPEPPRVVTVEEIQRIVASHFNIPEESMCLKRRTAELALPRQIAMYLSRELTSCSFPEIGERFGGKDHTTIMHAYRKIIALIKKDQRTKAFVDQVVKRFMERG